MRAGGEDQLPAQSPLVRFLVFGLVVLVMVAALFLILHNAFGMG
jgi:hypothetical protein